ncbi:TniQ family protein [Streptomyces sp. NBC_00638]|uniref:TniQ family protein n=1 Tax=Streptomyces sp. NBC_00638 TaxID=2975794 RepID=UPI00224CD4F2|nr:TniQ family protein [Streptomyces sp. NBC_00638]MCX5006743.1 TniQ family protein [Streptomyces sp. NBC_00638]
MTERRLARSLDPLPGESLPGFLLRLSCRLERSPRRLAELCGLVNGESCSQAYIRFLPDELKRRGARVLGLSVDEVTSLTLQRFSATYPPLEKMRLNAKRAGFEAMVNWVASGSSRYCPECLRGDGSEIQTRYGGPWKLAWHLPVVFACGRHGCLLEHACPICYLPLNSATGAGKRNLVQNLRQVGLHPLQCRNKSVVTDAEESSVSPGVLCEARLDQMAERSNNTVSSGELALYLELQQKIMAHLTSHDLESDRSSSERGTYFPDLIAVMQLIKLAWPVGAEMLDSPQLAARIESHVHPLLGRIAAQRERKERANRHDLKSAPAESELCGSLLMAADSLLGDRVLADLRMRLQSIVREAYKRSPSYAYRICQNPDISLTLSRATVRRIYGFSVRARLRIDEINFSLRAEEIPSFLPQAWYVAHLNSLASRLPRSFEGVDRYLRRAAPLRLAELVSGLSWTECAALVGVSKASAQRTLKYLGPRLDECGRWPEFEESVERLARDLDVSTCRVDFSRRRERMLNWRLPLDDWLAMCAEFPHLRRLREKRNSDTGSALVWSAVTEGEHTNSPVVQSLQKRGENSQPLAAGIARFVGHDLTGPTLVVRRRLDGYAAKLAAACDGAGELQVSVAKIIEEDAAAHDSYRLLKIPNSSENLSSAISREVLESYGDAVPEVMWELFRSIVPSVEGRVCSDRDVLGGILCVAVTGCGWNRLSFRYGVSGWTASVRFKEWTDVYVWERLGALARSRVSSDNDRKWIFSALEAITLRAGKSAG